MPFLRRPIGVVFFCVAYIIYLFPFLVAFCARVHSPVHTMFAHQPTPIHSGSGGPVRGTSVAFGGGARQGGGGARITAAQTRAARRQERSTRPLFGRIEVVERAKDKIRDTFNPEDPELVAERDGEVAAQQLILEIEYLEKDKEAALAEYKQIYETRGAAAAKNSAAFLRYNRLRQKSDAKRRRLDILEQSSENMQDAIADELTVRALASNNRAAAEARARQNGDLDLDEVIDDADENFAEQQEVDRRFLEDFRSLADRDEAYLDSDPMADPALVAIHEEISMRHDYENQAVRESLIDLPVPVQQSPAVAVPAMAASSYGGGGGGGDDWEDWLAQ